MRKFVEEHYRELLLILITVLAVSKWWIPDVRGFEKMYAASHWVLSYDHGLIRRGLVGTILQVWFPIVTIKDVHLVSSIAYCTFLALLLALSYFLLRDRDKEGTLFRLILVFLVNPASIAMLANDLGRFDLFLVMIAFLILSLMLLNKHFWLIPILMFSAMFIHEGFLILYAPTILSTLLFIYLWSGREKRILRTLFFSVTSVLVPFFILYNYGGPRLGYEEFLQFIQSRAAFSISPLSIRESYFSMSDHYALASSSLYDAGSIANLFLALLILSPVILILVNLWTHAQKNCRTLDRSCGFVFLATLSGLMIVPVATDYGRWLSGVVFCNFFVVFFLVGKGLIKVEDLVEYARGSFALLFVVLLMTYLLFGPLHDWNPYPYKDNLIVSSLAIISVLLFDLGFFLRWRSLNKVLFSER